MTKVKKKKKVFSFKKLLLCIIVVILLYRFIELEVNTYSTPLITRVFIDGDDNLNIKYLVFSKYRNIYYLYNEDGSIPDVNDSNWIKIDDKKIVIKLLQNKKYHVFIRNNDNIKEIEKAYNIGKIKNVNYNNKMYLAINSSKMIDLDIDFIGNIDNLINWSIESENVAKIDQNGLINAINKGETVISGKIGDFDIKIDLVVTDLIVDKPNSFDKNKPYLTCNSFTKEENDLIDDILKNRVKSVGYSTRAGAVEAARFLALEFPYRIDYFYENGRMSQSVKVDGEGRYYHEGLYLNDSRLSNVTNNKTGPITWGCPLHSNPINITVPNGIDCSGFVSWVLLNAGFNPGDIGAGITDAYDLTNTGKKSNITSKMINNHDIKVGDLLWKNIAGGHIAIIVGEDDDNYYVAESIAEWSTHKSIGVIINTYKKDTFSKSFNYVILMDSYYKEDGKLTNLWYKKK